MADRLPDRGSSPAPARRLLRLLVVGLLVLWAFVLGILVGQGSLASPEQLASLKESLTRLPLVGAWFREDSPPPSPETTPPQLSFYRELERQPGTAPTPRGRAKPTPRQTPGRAAPKPHAPPAPHAPHAPPVVKPPPKGSFVVQVASFKEENQARELAQRLARMGLSAYVRQVRLPKVGLRYRVRIGPFPSQEAAQAAAGRIRLQRQLAAYVTREE